MTVNNFEIQVTPPERTNVAWLNPSDGKVKFYIDGEWREYPAINKGEPGGVASLDDAGKVPSEQLPSYVDDVIEVEDYAHLPEEGESGKIYVTIDDGSSYRWTGSTYTKIGGGVTSPVNGHLVKTDSSGNLLDAGCAMVKLTKAEYETLATKDPSTVYIVTPSSGVFIGYTDKSLSSYNTLVSGKTPVGVVLINENVSLVLHKTKFSNTLWATEQGLIPGMQVYANRDTAALDFDGVGNTALVAASGIAGTAFTNATSTVFADGSSGYVPSGGEALALFANATNINTALSLLSGDALSDNMWTSSQTNAERAWMYFARFNRLDFAGKNNSRMESRVVAAWPKDGAKIYLGSTLISDSNLPSEIAAILATI